MTCHHARILCMIKFTKNSVNSKNLTIGILSHLPSINENKTISKKINIVSINTKINSLLHKF